MHPGHLWRTLCSAWAVQGCSQPPSRKALPGDNRTDVLQLNNRFFQGVFGETNLMNHSFRMLANMGMYLSNLGLESEHLCPFLKQFMDTQSTVEWKIPPTSILREEWRFTCPV